MPSIGLFDPGAKMEKKTFTLDQIEGAIEEDAGFCIECGTEVSGVEPDARKYHCPECHQLSVYGAETILLMGLCREGD